MSYEIPILNVTLVAGEDLSDSQYYAVKLNSSGQVVLASTGEKITGIIQDDPESGIAGLVMTHGISKAVLGDTVTAGEYLAVDSAGRLVPATGEANVVAQAYESGAVSEQRTVMLQCN